MRGDQEAMQNRILVCYDHHKTILYFLNVLINVAQLYTVQYEYELRCVSLIFFVDIVITFVYILKKM